MREETRVAGETRLKLGLDQLQVSEHVMVLEVGFVIYELSASLTP